VRFSVHTGIAGKKVDEIKKDLGEKWDEVTGKKK